MARPKRGYWIERRGQVWRVCWTEDRVKRTHSLRTTSEAVARRALGEMGRVEVPALRRGIGSLLDAPPARAWLGKVRRRARAIAIRQGVPFELSSENVRDLLNETNGFCAVTGIPFDLRALEPYGENDHCPWGPSLDRIEGALGYVRANCRFVCRAVNYAMNQWGAGVFWRILESYSCKNGRGGLIRTGDFHVPNVALYQAELRPDSDSHGSLRVEK